MSCLRIISVLFALSIILSPVSVLGINAVEVEEAVFEVYGAVLDAEAAGADVSGLIDRLNIAGGYLALAKMSLRIENLEGAAGNASLCIEGLEGIVEDAGILKDTVVRELDEYSRMAIIGSEYGVVTVIVCSLLGWYWFKKRYYKRVLEMRPGVVEGES